MRPITGSVFAAALLLVLAMPAAAATLEVGEGKEYANPSDAIAKAADGDTIRIAPGEYFDCAIIRQSKLTLEGTGANATAVLTDKACAGKGLLITAGDDITIRNLTLTRARVPDMNGAGIRAEGTNLTVEGVKFINNQNGILAASNKDSTIIIRNSEFTRNGNCSPCAHGIYINLVKLLRVENSKFFETRQAHHIKSRAMRTEVIGSELRDGPNGTASYMIEAPNGGTLIVRNNILAKGPKAENRSCAIMIGSEGVSQPTRELLIEGNTFINEGSYDTAFVENRTATEAMLKGNKITGRVVALRGEGEVR
jgi:hypothetical protein